MKLQLIFWSNKDSLNKVMLIIMLIFSLSKTSSLRLNNYKSKSNLKTHYKIKMKNNAHKYTDSSIMSKTSTFNSKFNNSNLESNNFTKSNSRTSIAFENTNVSKNLFSEKENDKMLANSTSASKLKALVENKYNFSNYYNSNQSSLTQSPQYVWNINNLKQNHYDKENGYYNDIKGDSNFLLRSTENTNKESESKDYNNDSIAVSTNFNSVSKLSSSFSSASYKNPILPSHIKKPQYVEKIGYYDRDPPSQRNSDAISVSNPIKDVFYQPFLN